MMIQRFFKRLRKNYASNTMIKAAMYGELKIVESQLAAGADVNAKNEEGKTAYVQAGGRSEIARLLERAQQKILSELIEAAQKGQIEKVKSLLQAG